MNRKRHTTEEKVRILRKANAGRTVPEVCREADTSTALTRSSGG